MTLAEHYARVSPHKPESLNQPDTRKAHEAGIYRRLFEEPSPVDDRVVACGCPADGT